MYLQTIFCVVSLIVIVEAGVKVDEKKCTMGRCPEPMVCMREDDGSHVCRFETCNEKKCGPKEECMPSFVGFVYCRVKVTCDGVKCKAGEKCEVRPLERCADDCPMKAACVKK